MTVLNPACIYVCVCCILSEFYTTEASTLLIEAVNSYFRLYGCGYRHNRIDEVPLTTGRGVHGAKRGGFPPFLA